MAILILLVGCSKEDDIESAVKEVTTKKDEEIKALETKLLEAEDIEKDNKNRITELEKDLKKVTLEFTELEKEKRDYFNVYDENVELSAQIEFYANKVKEQENQIGKLKRQEQKYIVQSAKIETRMAELADKEKFSSKTERIMGIQLNMTEEQVHTVLGAPDEVIFQQLKQGDTKTLQYDGFKVHLMDEKVYAVIVTKYGVDVIRNIQVGDRFSVIDEAFPSEDFTVPLEAFDVIEDVYDRHYYDFRKRLYPEMYRGFADYGIRFHDDFKCWVEFNVVDDMINEISLWKEIKF